MLESTELDVQKQGEINCLYQTLLCEMLKAYPDYEEPVYRIDPETLDNLIDEYSIEVMGEVAVKLVNDWIAIDGYITQK